jgi:hypothetical protein
LNTTLRARKQQGRIIVLVEKTDRLYRILRTISRAAQANRIGLSERRWHEPCQFLIPNDAAGRSWQLWGLSTIGSLISASTMGWSLDLLDKSTGTHRRRNFC